MACPITEPSTDVTATTVPGLAAWTAADSSARAASASSAASMIRSQEARPGGGVAHVTARPFAQRGDRVRERPDADDAHHRLRDVRRLLPAPADSS